MPNFSGFSKPTENYSKLPHEFISMLPEIDTVAELKTILYVLRHTWGFSEFDKPKKMTLDELQNGRKRRDGTRMDGGTGLAVNSIRSGIEKAVERGVLRVETDESDKARIEKWYFLNMANESKIDSRLSNIDTQESNIDNRTEKETIERKDNEHSEIQAEYKTEPDELDGIIHFEQKPQSIRNTIKEYFKLNIKWDVKYNREWMEWAISENITPDQIKLAADKWRTDKQFNWQVPTLKGIFEKWNLLMDAGTSNVNTPIATQDKEKGFYV